MKPEIANNLSLALPPKIPGTSQALERAISLLGNRTKGDLNLKTRQELTELVEVYPDAYTAAQWKQSLRQLNKHPDSDRNLLKTQTFASKRPSPRGEAEFTPETKIMLDWTSEALANYYLDDEGCYDRELVFQMQWWLSLPEELPPSAFLAKKFLEINLALDRAEDPFEFDLANCDFSLNEDPIVKPDSQLSFVEPLLRQALSKVDWCVIGDFLIQELSLKDRSRRRRAKNEST